MFPDQSTKERSYICSAINVVHTTKTTKQITLKSNIFSVSQKISSLKNPNFN